MAPSTLKKRNDEFLVKNGAQLLEDSIASFKGGAKPVRMFSEKELRKATNDYDADRLLDRNRYYTIYKGEHENRTIVIKKYEKEKKGAKESALNEAVILSHVNHRNVVNLIGCCIETEIPIIVCEYLANGNLYHHIHEVDPSSRMSWGNRLRIATEIAYGLAYLHIATSRPLVVRNIKSKNIFLDERYIAKMTDFGLSVLIPLGEKFVETQNIVGTYGYIDPQYIATNKLTEKIDVYSFGIIFIELLTGKKPRAECIREILSIIRSQPLPSKEDGNYDDKDRVLPFEEQIFRATEMERINVILNACIREEGNEDKLIGCVELAVRCIRKKGEERPTMKEVTEELRRIRRI